MSLTELPDLHGTHNIKKMRLKNQMTCIGVYVGKTVVGKTDKNCTRKEINLGCGNQDNSPQRQHHPPPPPPPPKKKWKKINKNSPHINLVPRQLSPLLKDNSPHFIGQLVPLQLTIPRVFTSLLDLRNKLIYIRAKHCL